MAGLPANCYILLYFLLYFYMNEWVKECVNEIMNNWLSEETNVGTHCHILYQYYTLKASYAMLCPALCRPWTITASFRWFSALATARNIHGNAGSTSGPASRNSANWTSTLWFDTWCLQAAVEDSFVFVDVWLWIWSPWVDYLTHSLIVRVEMSVYLLTYLLTVNTVWCHRSVSVILVRCSNVSFSFRCY